MKYPRTHTPQTKNPKGRPQQQNTASEKPLQRFCHGGHSERETPGPIPNPEVKPPSADGTAHASVWESKTPPDNTPTAPTTPKLRGHNHTPTKNHHPAAAPVSPRSVPEGLVAPRSCTVIRARWSFVTGDPLPAHRGSRTSSTIFGQPVVGNPVTGGTMKLGSQSGFGRIRSWVLKENPRGTIPGTGAATGAATTATGKAPPSPGGVPGKPGEARGGTTANGREDEIGRRGIRADATVTQVPAARIRPETIGVIPGGDGNRDGRSRPARMGTAGHEFLGIPGMTVASGAIPGKDGEAPGEKAPARNGKGTCRNRERPRRRTNPPHPITSTSRCCQSACARS